MDFVQSLYAKFAGSLCSAPCDLTGGHSWRGDRFFPTVDGCEILISAPATMVDTILCWYLQENQHFRVS